MGFFLGGPVTRHDQLPTSGKREDLDGATDAKFTRISVSKQAR